MDVKKLLKSSALASDPSLNSLSEADRTSLLSLAAAYREASKSLKKALNEKSLISRQFKDAKGDADRLTALKADMQSAGKQIALLESELKGILNQANQLLVVPEETKPLPGQFLSKEVSLQKNLTFTFLDIDSEEWAEFVDQHKSIASSSHMPQLAVAINKAFGHSSQVFVAYAGNSLVGGLPFTVTRSPIFGHNATSIPFFNYGGALTQYKDVESALVSEANQILSHTKAEQVEIRTTTNGLNGHVSDKKVSMLLALPEDLKTLDDQLGTKVRAQCKKANSHNPSVKFGGLELLNDFYQVFAINMRDLGTPVYSKQWFKALLETNELNTTLVVCYVAEKPVSVGFLLGHNSMLEIPWASTLKSANKLDMNMWMYRRILDFAVEQKYEHFDFGRSTKDAPTFRFKKQWGAEPVQHYWYHARSDGAEPGGANPDNPKYKLVISVWKRLPVWLTKLIGPAIVKQIP